jgi:hypothetical protein
MTAKVVRRLQSALVGVAASLALFIPVYKVFLGALIKYWEWQNGHKMKITLWADERAFPLTLVVCSIVFYVIFSYLQRRVPPDEQIARWKLALWTAAAAITLFVLTIAYILHSLRAYQVHSNSHLSTRGRLYLTKSAPSPTRRMPSAKFTA